MNKRIQTAMKERERSVLRFLKRERGLPPMALPLTWYHAMDRLKSRGRLRFNRRTRRYEILSKGIWK